MTATLLGVAVGLACGALLTVVRIWLSIAATERAVVHCALGLASLKTVEGPAFWLDFAWRHELIAARYERRAWPFRVHRGRHWKRKPSTDYDNWTALSAASSSVGARPKARSVADESSTNGRVNW